MQSTISRPQTRNAVELLDSCFPLYREHFWTYLAIVIIIEVPAIMILATLVRTHNIEVLTFENFFFYARLDVAIFFIFNQVTLQPLYIFTLLALGMIPGIRTAVLINATAQIYHTGSTSVAQAYRVPVVCIVVIGVLSLVGSILSATAPMLDSNLLSLAILFPLPFVCIYQIILFENPNPFIAITRNWYLIQGSMLRILGLLFILFILDWLCYGISISPLIYVDPFTELNGIISWVTAAISYTIAVLFFSFSTIVFTLLYFELRARRDGYDLELKTQQHFANR